MSTPDTPALAAWHLFTRLGEAQLLAPAAAAVALLLLRRPEHRGLALNWLARLATAAALTTASKLAFIGWGIGWAATDFTGFSGHAMFAMAIYPLLLAALLPSEHPGARRAAAASGAALALGVAFSRVAVDAHSLSEVVAGAALGGMAGMLAWPLSTAARPGSPALWWLTPAVALWLLATPLLAPPSQTHAWVTRLALLLSGNPQAYTREALRARG